MPYTPSGGHPLTIKTHAGLPQSAKAYIIASMKMIDGQASALILHSRQFFFGFHCWARAAKSIVCRLCREKVA